MSKRISKFITIMLVAAMMLSCFSTYNASTNVYAAKRTTATKNIKQNNKKNKVKWKLKKGVLTIYGKGKMPESMTFDAGKYSGKIKKVIIKEGVKSVCDDAFRFVKGIKKIEFPKTLNKIGCHAFNESEVKNVKFKSVVELEEDAINFTKTKYINMPIKGGKITLKNGVMNIKGQGKIPNFSEIDSLSKVNIEEGIEQIPQAAFSGSENLKEINIPSTVKEIGKYAFAATGIEKIVIPASVEKIAANIVRGCVNLTEVTMPGNFECLGSDVAKYYTDRALTRIEHNRKIETVKFNTPLNIDVITSIPTNNFEVMENDPNYKSINGVIYSKDGKKLIRIPSRRKEVKVEQGCETVESSAFVYGMYEVGTKVWNINCSELQKIELSSTVKNIEFVHDEFYDKLEKKNYYSDKEELDYEKYMLGMDLRNFKICEVSYNGKTINPQNYIKELTKEQNNNGLGEMVNEINMMIK